MNNSSENIELMKSQYKDLWKKKKKEKKSIATEGNRKVYKVQESGKYLGKSIPTLLYEI